MKKILFLVAVMLLIFCLIPGTSRAASGNEVTWQVITSTGVTLIEFTRITTEIYVVLISTGHIAYVNWTSTTPVSTNFYLYRADVSKSLTEHTEEIQSSKFSVDVGTTPPVHIRVQWKYWRQ